MACRRSGGTGFRTLFGDVGTDFVHVPSLNSLFVAAIESGAALAVHPIDSTFNAHLETTSIFGAGDHLGGTAMLMGATFAVYGVGLASGHNRVTHVAMDLVRAQVVSEVMTQALKVAVRRDRPDGQQRLFVNFDLRIGRRRMAFDTYGSSGLPRAEHPNTLFGPDGLRF